MLLGKPVWSANYTGLLIRVPLAAYFLITGYFIIQNLAPFIDAVRQLDFFLPNKLAILYAAILPYLQLATGSLLLIGLWTNAVAIVAALIFLSYIVVNGVFPYPEAPEIFNKDIILLFASLTLLACGAGAFSIDAQKQ